jgi:hypothetical protein
LHRVQTAVEVRAKRKDCVTEDAFRIIFKGTCFEFRANCFFQCVQCASRQLQVKAV